LADPEEGVPPGAFPEDWAEAPDPPPVLPRSAGSPMSTPPRKRAPSSRTTRGAEMSPWTDAELRRMTCSSALRSPSTLPSTTTIRPAIPAFTFPSGPTVTECCFRSTEPSTRPWIRRSSSPVTSPRMEMEGPMVAGPPSPVPLESRSGRDWGSAGGAEGEFGASSFFHMEAFLGSGVPTRAPASRRPGRVGGVRCWRSLDRLEAMVPAEAMGTELSRMSRLGSGCQTPDRGGAE